MYLSRMHLNTRRRGTAKLLSSPQAMHAATMSAFPPGAIGDGRVLWRVDRTPEATSLYLLSPTVPSFEHLQEQAGWANRESWIIRDYAPVLGAVAIGRRFSFRLAANPVRVVTGEDGIKRRAAHVTAAQQLGWLLERADRLGVRFPDDPEGGSPSVAVTRRETLRFKRGTRRVTVARSQYDGLLEVVDPDALRAALTDGVGKAKAYGCGLLTLAPVSGS